jgi:hypothetical protein
MHDAGPKAPQLAPLAPRLSAADFCRRAFVAAGGAVEADGPMRARVRLPGRAPWTAVFDGDDPLLADGAARLGEAAVRLYEPGSQDFERLAAEYDRWWDSIQKDLVNEDLDGPAENPFKTAFEAQVGVGVTAATVPVP